MGLLDDLAASDSERESVQRQAERERATAVIRFRYEALPATREAILDFWARDWSGSNSGTGGPVFRSTPEKTWRAGVHPQRNHRTEPLIWVDQQGSFIDLSGLPLSLYQRQVWGAGIRNLDAYTVAALTRFVRTLDGSYMPQPPSSEEVQRLAEDPRFRRDMLPRLGVADLAKFLSGDDEPLTRRDAHLGAPGPDVADALRLIGFPMGSSTTQSGRGLSKTITTIRFWVLEPPYTDASEDWPTTRPGIYLSPEGAVTGHPVQRIGLDALVRFRDQYLESRQ